MFIKVPVYDDHSQHDQWLNARLIARMREGTTTREGGIGTINSSFRERTEGADRLPATRIEMRHTSEVILTPMPMSELSRELTKALNLPHPGVPG